MREVLWFLTRLRFPRASIGFSLSLCAFIPFYRPALFSPLSSARIFLGPSLSASLRFPHAASLGFFRPSVLCRFRRPLSSRIPKPLRLQGRSPTDGSRFRSVFKKTAPPQALRPKNAALGAESGKKTKNDGTIRAIRTKGKARTAKRSLSRSSTSCGRRFVRRHRPQDAPEEASCF